MAQATGGPYPPCVEEEEEQLLHKEPATVGKVEEFRFRVRGLPAGDEYSGWNVSWGDGTSEPVAVRLSAECPGWYQAEASPMHTYDHVGRYEAVLTGTDTTSDTQVTSSQGVRVDSAAPDRVTVSVTDVAPKTTRLSVSIRTGEPRKISELHVIVIWGGVPWVAGKITGSGRSFRCSVSRRWKRLGRRHVVVDFGDEWAPAGGSVWERWIRVPRR